MNIKSAIITATRALARNKMRSSLTSIGIIIGVSSVIVMIGLGNSVQIVIRQKIYSYGANALSIRCNKNILSSTDIITLKKSFYQIKHISPVLEKKRIIGFGDCLGGIFCFW